LTIGQLAERTGTRPGTLRMWESRYGFPQAQRLTSGHRRYAESDVERVRDVLALRATGLSLPAAIEQSRSERPAPSSIFASLLRHAPELTSHALSKRLLVPMSHAIEDEAAASGARGMLAGSFQRERFYRQAQARWRTLAAPAELSVALADFERAQAPLDGPAEVPVDRRHPLSREWALVWDSPGFAACLAARERSHPDAPDAERLFDSVWSVERPVVRHAAHAVVELANEAAPELALAVPERLAGATEPDPHAARRATALTNRMLAYVAELSAPRGA
jgi:MerR family transcriptional regulator, light-induced transcriptional regulator